MGAHIHDDAKNYSIVLPSSSIVWFRYDTMAKTLRIHFVCHQTLQVSFMYLPSYDISDLKKMLDLYRDTIAAFSSYTFNVEAFTNVNGLQECIVPNVYYAKRSQIALVFPLLRQGSPCVKLSQYNLPAVDLLDRTKQDIFFPLDSDIEKPSSFIQFCNIIDEIHGLMT